MTQSGLTYQTKKRLPTIIKGLLEDKTHEQIAAIIGVTRATVERDLRAWRETGGFEEWVDEEFFRLHSKVRTEDEKLAYKTIARFKERILARKQEIEAKGDLTFILKSWRPERDA